jgi:hypothetical protein
MTAMPSICAAAQDFYIVSVKWLIHLPRPLLKIQHGDIDLAPKGERFGTETRSHSCLRAGSCDGGDRPIDHDVGGPLPESREQFGSADPAEADDLPGSKLLKGQAPGNEQLRLANAAKRLLRPTSAVRMVGQTKSLILFSCRSPLCPSENANRPTPVKLAPGRLRLATKPALTGSPPWLLKPHW